MVRWPEKLASDSLFAIVFHRLPTNDIIPGAAVVIVKMSWPNKAEVPASKENDSKLVISRKCVALLVTFSFFRASP